MIYTSVDLSLFYHNTDNTLHELIAVQVYVYGNLAAGSDELMKLTDKFREKFESKPRELPPLLFSGVMINPNPKGYFMEQNAHSNQIEKIPEDCGFYLFRTTLRR